MDCAMGISGDMFLGAMIDLGVDLDVIKGEIGKLPVEKDEVEVLTSREVRHSITGTAFRVKARETKTHRSYATIKKMIEESSLKPCVKKLSLEIFRLIAISEGRFHGVPPEEVHFHEIGAMDSIVDIIGAAVAVDALGAPSFFSSPVALGTGSARTMHGVIPIPAPATLDILKGVPVTPGPAPFELTTPTGAAIIKTLSEGFGPMPAMVVEATGYGAGKKDFRGAANLLRAIRGRAAESAARGAEEGKEDREGLLVLETNLDDMTPELCGYLMERLLKAGALDVYFTHALMKKSRPALLLTVLTTEEKKEALLETIFTESTTIGIRMHRVQRRCLERTMEKVQTPFGEVSVKVSSYRGAVVNVEPEYEDCRRAALEGKIPLKAVMDAARAAAGPLLKALNRG